MYHAKVKTPIFFRIGTCGGIGIEGGNVIITEEALNAELKPYLELVSHVLEIFQVYVYKVVYLDNIRVREEPLSITTCVSIF